MNHKIWVTAQQAASRLPYGVKWIEANKHKFETKIQHGRLVFRLDSVLEVAPSYDPAYWMSITEARRIINKSDTWFRINRDKMTWRMFGVKKIKFSRESVNALHKQLQAKAMKKKFMSKGRTRNRTNDVGTSIEKFIEQERTLIFDNQLVANKAAREMNSSAYPVYENGFTNGEYAVPK